MYCWLNHQQSLQLVGVQPTVPKDLATEALGFALLIKPKYKISNNNFVKRKAISIKPVQYFIYALPAQSTGSVARAKLTIICSQRVFGAQMTSYQRQCDVIRSPRHLYDVSLRHVPAGC